MRTILEFFIGGVLAYVLSVIVTPLVSKLSVKLHLVDYPNYRKVHRNPIPLIGGIVIVCISILTGCIMQAVFNKEIFIIMTGAVILFILGAIDDKKDVKAQHKLLIQLCISFVMALYGIRITSLFGFLGIYELPVYGQYVITVLLITGAVNSFNLMDGVDGLAGIIALSGFTFLLFSSLYSHHIMLAKMSIILIGCLISFLKYNFSEHQKIFLGDSGSLFLGFLLVSLGIYCLRYDFEKEQKTQLLYFLFVFMLPVFDFIRVCIGRIIKRISPFTADRTHLHHYMTEIGLTPKKIGFSILLIHLSLLVTAYLLVSFNVNLVFVICIAAILSYYKILHMIRTFNIWKYKIKEMETSF